MIKRIFDIAFSIVTILLFAVVLLIIWVGAIVDTQSNGLFLQSRVGQFGNTFTIFKFRSIHPNNNTITSYGVFIRKYKLDELPQLLNVLFGNMSVVGPRPDIIGYYNKLKGEQELILRLKPGLTSEAAIKYFKEEEVLQHQNNPLKYNDEIIFPDKVKINLKYYYDNSFLGDLKIIWKTILIIFNYKKI